MTTSQFVARAILVAILVLIALWSAWATYSLLFITATTDSAA